ncbi:MAG: KH domain-containing protein [Bacilli bacterium]|nr:KH domain-containing protein [Bacilli bacterium]MDD4282377.1 KH domain-containing protein [Bacilli bacterium]MDD4718248.1 KH domain-containing protein [Bacilli bacterium]
MLQIHNFEGKTKEDVLDKAINVLEVEENEIFVSYSETESKLFKSKKTELKVLKNIDLIKYVKDYFTKLSDLMGIDIKCEIKIRNEILNINLITSDNSIIIGREGKTLNAIQSLLKQNLNNNFPFNIKLNMDVAGYKNKKVKNLEYSVKKICKEVLNNKIGVQLDPMNSYERRIVHTVISLYDELESESEGTEPNRFIVIKYREN